MAAFKLTIKRVQSGTQQGTGVVQGAVTTEAQVNQALARDPDNIEVVMNVATEAQVRGLLQYAKAVDNGTDTSSVETAVSAII
jgi:hypothetical protein